MFGLCSPPFAAACLCLCPPLLPLLCLLLCLPGLAGMSCKPIRDFASCGSPNCCLLCCPLVPMAWA